MKRYEALQGLIGQVLTTGPVTQVPWDEFLPKSIDKQLKRIQKTRKMHKDWSFHGPWLWE